MSTWVEKQEEVTTLVGLVRISLCCKVVINIFNILESDNYNQRGLTGNIQNGTITQVSQDAKIIMGKQEEEVKAATMRLLDQEM